MPETLACLMAVLEPCVQKMVNNKAEGILATRFA